MANGSHEPLVDPDLAAAATCAAAGIAVVLVLLAVRLLASFFGADG